MVRGMFFVILSTIFLVTQAWISFLNAKWGEVFLCIISTIFIFAFLQYISKDVLNSEITSLNYSQYLSEAQNSSRERKTYIASLLKDDCMIQVKELDIDIITDKRNILEDTMFYLGSCHGLMSSEPKKSLLEYLVKERLVSYSQ